LTTQGQVPLWGGGEGGVRVQSNLTTKATGRGNDGRLDRNDRGTKPTGKHKGQLKKRSTASPRPHNLGSGKGHSPTKVSLTGSQRKTPTTQLHAFPRTGSNAARLNPRALQTGKCPYRVSSGENGHYSNNARNWHCNQTGGKSATGA